jgi:regulator of sigma E protease
METIINFLHQGVSHIVPFIVLLGVLIFVHELGHFMVAKFFGVRVETFSLGFGRKILQKKWGDTTYCISIIPFGGYVKMFGDDSSADIPADQQKYSFSHQKVLPRIAIVLAGPTMNALFAIVLFTLITGIGEEVLRPKVGDVFANTQAYEIGFRTDDVISKINNSPIDRWDNLKKAVENNNDKPLTFTVLHDNKELILHGTPKTVVNKNVLVSKAVVGEIDGLSYLNLGSAVGISDRTSPAAQAGLKTDDIITKVDGQELYRWTQLEDILRAAADKKGQVNLEVERGEQKNIPIILPLTPKAPLAGMEPSDLYLSNVLAKSAADVAGIKIGDRLVSINGVKLYRWEDVIKNVQSYKETSAPLKVIYIRNGQKHEADIVPRMISQTDPTGIEQKNYALGIVTGLVYANPDTFIAKESNPVKMLSKGFDDAVHWTVLTAVSFMKLAEGQVSSKSIGGPLMIGKLASDTWKIGISPFLKIMAIISINLFLLNLLPVPVLDGGHLLFFVIELFKGSPLSLRKMEIMQQVGLFLLLALMVFSMFNDIVRFFSAS